MGGSLLLLDLGAPAPAWQRDLACALRLGGRLLLYSRGSHALTQRLLDGLGHVFDATARAAPCADVVPLLPLAGWTLGAVAGLAELDTILAPPPQLTSLQGFAGELNSQRPAGLGRVALRPLELEQPPAELGLSPPEEGLGAGKAQESSGAPEGEALQFQRVAVGGTFDRLHAGHRLLLAATALASTQAVFIGITEQPVRRAGDRLLARKAFHEYLQPYGEREQAAAAYVQAVRPGLQVTAGALLDPQEPTAAATDPGMGALVVSEETVPGGEAINADRRQRGFRELRLVVVATVAASPSLPGGKLSSTGLRQREAEAAGREGQGPRRAQQAGRKELAGPQ